MSAPTSSSAPRPSTARVTPAAAALELTRGDARFVALRAQGLTRLPSAGVGQVGTALADRSAVVGQTLRALGAVQLDTVSVLARSHELVPYARLGPIGRDAVEAAYWGPGTGVQHPQEPTTFEYWSHAACVLPLEDWPLFAFRRRAYRRRGFHWHKEPTRAIRAVRKALQAEGPLTTTGLGGAKKSADWWDWSDAKTAAEWLLMLGEVACVRRVGWRRVYDLAERAVPPEFRQAPTGTTWSDDDGVIGPDDDTCIRDLLCRSARVMGVGTFEDIVDVHRLLPSRALPRPVLEGHLRDLVEMGRLVAVAVEGWDEPAWADPVALAAGDSASSRTTLLSPFDSLVWHRGRTARLFDFDYTMELYVPQKQRVHGYFTMPVLHRGKLVARVDPKRDGRTLHARQVTFETGPRGGVPPAAVSGVATALSEAAAWVGCDSVRVDRVVPATAARALAAALR